MFNAFTFSGLNGGIGKAGRKNAGLRKRRGVTSRPLPAVQRLEDRRLFSVGATPNPISAVTLLRETTNVPFTADLGSFTYLPPGSDLSASITWGDGTTSTGVIKADGVGSTAVIKFEVDGSHTYAKAGSFPILATVFAPGVTATSPDRVVANLHDVAIVTAKTTNTPLDGTVSGTYSIIPPTTTNSGSEYRFNGTGTAGIMGPVSAIGEIDQSASTGASTTATGLATGTLTLTSAATTASAGGSVTLRMTASAPSKPGAFPSLFTYVITGGTGIYADASGSGTIAVTLGSSSSANSFEFVIKSASASPLLPIVPVMMA